MGSGGARVGAGRPRKAKEEKILEGREEMPNQVSVITNVSPIPVEQILSNMPAVEDYMTAIQRDGKPLTADLEFKKIYIWATRMGCQEVIPVMLLEQYAMNRARWKALQNAISEYGYVSKKSTSNNVQLSPFFTALVEIEKQMNTSYVMINQMAREHCITGFVEYKPEDAEMERILKKQGG